MASAFSWPCRRPLSHHRRDREADVLKSEGGGGDAAEPSHCGHRGAIATSHAMIPLMIASTTIGKRLRRRENTAVSAIANAMPAVTTVIDSTSGSYTAAERIRRRCQAL